jgi:hypothetical protein
MADKVSASIRNPAKSVLRFLYRQVLVLPPRRSVSQPWLINLRHLRGVGGAGTDARYGWPDVEAVVLPVGLGSIELLGRQRKTGIPDQAVSCRGLP